MLVLLLISLLYNKNTCCFYPTTPNKSNMNSQSTGNGTTGKEKCKLRTPVRKIALCKVKMNNKLLQHNGNIKGEVCCWWISSREKNLDMPSIFSFKIAPCVIGNPVGRNSGYEKKTLYKPACSISSSISKLKYSCNPKMI